MECSHPASKKLCCKSSHDIQEMTSTDPCQILPDCILFRILENLPPSTNGGDVSSLTDLRLVSRMWHNVTFKNEITRCLLISKSSPTPLSVACIQGANERVMIHLVRSVDVHVGGPPHTVTHPNITDPTVLDVMVCACYAYRRGYNDLSTLVLTRLGSDDDVTIEVLAKTYLHMLDHNSSGLCVATSLPTLDLLKALLIVGVSADAGGNGGGDALCFALKCGNIEAIDVLLNAGANVNARNGIALLRAVAHRNVRGVERLLEAGADVHVRNDEPLITASTRGYYAIVDALVLHGADIDAQNGESLIAASELNHVSVVGILLTAGANFTDGYAFVRAAAMGHLRVIQMLLDAGVDVNVCDGGALIHACGRGHFQVVKTLMDAGADVTVRYHAAVRNAAARMQLDVLKVLVDIGGVRFDDELKKEGEYALCAAAMRRDMDSIRRFTDVGARDANLIVLGAVLDIPEPVDLVKELMRHAVPSTRDKTTENVVLCSAVEKGLSDVVDVLIDAGFEIQNPKILVSSVSGYDNVGDRIIKSLAAAGRKTKWFAITVRTALIRAVHTKDATMVSLILEYYVPKKRDDIYTSVVYDLLEFSLCDCASEDKARVLLTHLKPDHPLLFDNRLRTLMELLAAVEGGRVEAVSKLVETTRGDKVSYVTALGNLPLKRAVMRRDATMTEELVRQGARATRTILTAASVYDFALVTQLQRHLAEGVMWGSINVLYAAVLQGKRDVVRDMVSRGDVDVNSMRYARDTPLLCLAAERGDVDIMLALIDAGADVDVWHGEALKRAIASKVPEAVHLLLSRGVTLPRDPASMLELASRQGNIIITGMLLQTLS